MHLTRYKSVLALPGMRTFMLVSLIARIPTTAWTTALTLSIVLDRHRMRRPARRPRRSRWGWRSAPRCSGGRSTGVGRDRCCC